MKDVMIRRRPCLIFALSLAVTWSAAAAWVLHRRAQADLEFTGMKAAVRGLIAEIDALDTTRPVLWGTPESGHAWDHYLPAVEGAPDGLELMSAYLRGSPKSDSKSVRAWVDAHAAVLTSLQKGARRTEARPPYSWEDRGVRVSRGLQYAGQQITYLASCRARLLHEEGRNKEALELLLDLSVFCRDQGLIPEAQGEYDGVMRYLRWALDEILRLVQLGGLKADELVFLDRALEQLDLSFPDRRFAVLGDAANVGMTLIHEDRRGEILYDTTPERRALYRSRWLFSSRKRACETFFAAESWARRAVQAESLALEENFQACAAIVREQEAWDEYLVNSMHSLDRACSLRDSRTRLRLVRMAVHFKATGEVLHLADPHGGRLPHEIEGSTLRAWSSRHRDPHGRPKNPTGCAYWGCILVKRTGT